MNNTLRNLILSTLFAVTSACAQGLVIPQVADGGGWSSTVVLTNTTASSAEATLTFYQDTTPGNTELWTPPFVGGAATSGLVMPAGSSLFLQTTGIAPTVTQGWAQLISTAGVVGYVVYTYSFGQTSSGASAPAVSGASRIMVPFDNTAGVSTTLAVVNANASDLSISVNFSIQGRIIKGSLTRLPGEGQLAFVMSTQFPETAGLPGLAEFYTNTGSFAIIALRATTNTDGTFSFASAPVYPETGPPVL
jgi:hypothetical protein